ncbi:MAG: OmpH family outer membrane protein [Chitinophagia bacterium]|nr:OmpH family outer membrane protein [Chitinophagia bacterium]
MKKVLMVLALGIGAVQVAVAQNKTTGATTTPTTGATTDAKERTGLKIGWIVSGELLAAMPEKVKADSDLAKYARDFQNQLESMMKDYQTKTQYFQDNGNTMSEAIKEVKMKEIQDLQNRIESVQQSAKEKVNQKQQDLYGPILDKAEKAINAVAKEKGFDYIFDRNGGTLLYGRESDNILPLVKAKLGIK